MSLLPPTQCPGETPWDAIVEYGCMDIIEEAEFEKFVLASGESTYANLATLELLYLLWKDKKHKHE